MENKKADNKIITTKEKLSELDNMIETERKKVKKIDAMQQDATLLNKNMNKCIDLLSKSIKGTATKNMLNDIYETTKSTYVNITSSLDEISILSIKTISKLSKQKDDIIKEEKKNRGECNASRSN